MDAQNDYGQTPLHIALARGNTKSIEKLVMYEASVNAADLDGCTSLHYITSRTDGVEPPTEDSPVTYKVCYPHSYFCDGYRMAKITVAISDRISKVCT